MSDTTDPSDDSVPTVRLLNADGELTARQDYPLGLSDDRYRGLYRDMVLVRRLDDEATILQRQGELGIWAGLRGQEAAQVGAGRALLAGDFAFPTYRDHGVAWCRGVDPLDVLMHFRGVHPCAYSPDEHGLAPYSIVLASQLPHAVGWAMGSALAGDGHAALACFGDGTCSQGDTNEAFVWAAVYRAPVVFFCQNNQWAISTPTANQSLIPLYRRATGFGFPGVRVDGNDVLATYAVTRAALERARAGAGPTLVEAYTYRMAAHTTSDDPTRYCPPGETDTWRRLDPVHRMRSFLVRQGLADAEFFEALDRESDALAERVRTGCRAAPDPDPLSMFEHVYTRPTPHLRRQRDALGEYLAGFAEEAAG